LLDHPLGGKRRHACGATSGSDSRLVHHFFFLIRNRV